MSESVELMSIGEAARVLGVAVDTLRRWEREGKIAATRTLGGQRRFTRSDVEAAIETQERAS
jgi:excisionase family DNA binding protein